MANQLIWGIWLGILLGIALALTACEYPKFPIYYGESVV